MQFSKYRVRENECYKNITPISKFMGNLLSDDLHIGNDVLFFV